MFRRIVKIMFPIAVTIIAGIFVPAALAAIGFLMFGNLIRESGVLEELAKPSK